MMMMRTRERFGRRGGVRLSPQAARPRCTGAVALGGGIFMTAEY
jgi:hypothetical protein